MSRDLRSIANGLSQHLVRDGQASARLAHVRQELLAPVNAIAGYADILRDEANQIGLPALTPDIDRILASAEALLSLVEGLLDVRTTTARREGESLSDYQERLL